MTRNITVSISDKLANEMIHFSEVNWSEICRRAIQNYIKSRNGIPLVPYSEREEKINDLVEFMKKRSGLLKEDLIAHLINKWLYTPTEVNEILSIAIGMKLLSEAIRKKNEEHYILYLSPPRGIGLTEFINHNKIREDMNNRNKIL